MAGTLPSGSVRVASEGGGGTGVEYISVRARPAPASCRCTGAPGCGDGACTPGFVCRASAPDTLPGAFGATPRNVFVRLDGAPFASGRAPGGFGT
ncbi:MAG: hypothetical protein R3B70_36180 [Polyangiaceae bacterium]